MNKGINRREFVKATGLALTAAAVPSCISSRKMDTEVKGLKPRPNIVWIVAEDTSAHFGCYGETTVKTPNVDAMAKRGMKFDNAYVTCPVCSPCRSAMVMGAYQTTLGIHHHRSQRDGDSKGSGNEDYYASYRIPVDPVPKLFRDAGYFVSLGKNPSIDSPGKTDYNFIYDHESLYDGPDWRNRPDDKPFFAQIMLKGGKGRGGAKKYATNPASVKLPPYYPDRPVFREDWASYLNSVVRTDAHVGEILQSLQDAGVADDTVVFFWTDHGVSHLRGKQFLYDEGIHVPLVVQFPDNLGGGRVRDDFVVQIDVAATSLSLAGIPTPRYIQGRNLFAKDYEPRAMAFSARDRCDETVETIRSVHAHRFKYIRNFMSHMSHMQPNQYKDGKLIVQTARQLYKEGKLNELQARIFQPTRPPEELYDIKKDPFETVNLACNPEYAKCLTRLRSELYDWMIDSGDLGLIPEPILEDLGKRYGNKYYVLQQPENRNLIRNIIDVIEAGEHGDTTFLLDALSSATPSLRYWAATWLGNLGDQTALKPLARTQSDPVDGVRVAAALALCKLGRKRNVETLIKEIDNTNLIVGMYAIRAIEVSAIDTPAVRKAVEKAKDSRYEFTRRYAKRLSGKFNG